MGFAIKLMRCPVSDRLIGSWDGTLAREVLECSAPAEGGGMRLSLAIVSAIWACVDDRYQNISLASRSGIAMGIKTADP